jgi:hypothetical protein
MAFNVSALSDYTEQNADSLVIKSLFGARTQEIIAAEGTIQTGIKSAETVNILETDATFQTGGTCGFLSSGTTNFSQRTITVGKIKVNEALCPKALEAKYTQKALQIGSRYEKIPFEKQYTDLKAGTIAEQMEVAIWQGDTTSANANLNKFDGYVKLIDAASAVTANGNPTGITTGTGITPTNVRGIVTGVYLALPQRVAGKKDVRIFCGWDTFQKFIAAYTEANLFNFAPKGTEVSAENGEVIIPGTFYRLTAVHGLDGTNRLFGLRTSNMYMGVDLENEEERWEIFFAKEADEIRFVAEWKAGVQVAFPNEIVSFKLV